MTECFLCEPEERLILFRGELIVILNKYPVETGHIMVFVPGRAGHNFEMSVGIDRLCSEAISYIWVGLRFYSHLILKQSGPDSGQMTDHIHWHLIPRKKACKPLTIPRPQKDRREITDEQLWEVKEKWRRSGVEKCFA